jgi:hypothetical protein
MHYLSIGAVFRMENSWLDEWIQYHHALGVEHFFLYSDDQDTRVADKILWRYIEAGFVECYYEKDMTHLDLNPNVWRQKQIYKELIQEHGRKTQWMAMIDLDEFLLPHTCNDLRVFLQDYEEFSALAVHWNIFGTSGYIKRPSTQINHLLHRASTDWTRNRTVKSIIRPDRIVTKKIRNVHLFPLTSGITVDENGHRVFKPTTNMSDEKICLNHYILRSYQDFCEVKSVRTRSKFARRINHRFFEHHDRNEVFDDEISVRFGHCIDIQSFHQ